MMNEFAGGEQKHSPGPWRVSENRHNILTDTRRDRPTLLASVWHELDRGIPSEAEHAEAHANARLIAAAPELLEACKIALNYGRNKSRDSRDSILREADRVAGILRDAIAKAEGETNDN